MDEKDAKTQVDAAGRPADKGGSAPQRPAELPPLDFSTLVLSLSSSVLMNLGLVENPVTKKTEKELPLAHQTIDLLALLKEKTAGNLSPEEAKLLDDVLHELRLCYCRVNV